MTIETLKWMLKEAVIDKIEHYYNDDPKAEQENDRCIAALTDAIRQLEWTPVSEKPEKAGVYIVSNDMEKANFLGIDEYHGQIEIMAYSKKHDKWSTNSIVTHWRALPQPPEKDGANEQP